MATQFQNAFSDNALKYLVIYVVLAGMSEGQRDSYVALAGALFGAPFILFSMFGGWLADRFSKQKVLSSVKLAEIGIMLFASLGLYLENLWLELGAIFLMGCHSAIFGPSKYGILPEILPLKKLSWGNGLLELLTFLGIIAGTVAGGQLKEHLEGRHYLAGLILAALAVAGWGVSTCITHVPAADPHCRPRINPISDLWVQLKLMKPDRDLWRANWGNTGFWFVAALVPMNMLIYAKEVLKLTDAQNSYLNAALAIGIGLGSALAGVLSRGRIEYGLVPVGAAGMALSTIPMGIHGISTLTFSACLVALGLCAGLFIVPLAAVLQHKPAPDRKGAVQGAANLMSFVGISAASGTQPFLRNICHLESGQIFWFCGATALLAGIYIALSRPDAVRNLLQSLFKRAS
jgi:acyl-[acyl-carrier-protein]-phospholipid O-acyltransferase/long-chain-fatty-acid--[acyl-carrier-protein] ligase